jgi:hypothetical protein
MSSSVTAIVARALRETGTALKKHGGVEVSPNVTLVCTVPVPVSSALLAVHCQYGVCTGMVNRKLFACCPDH